MAQRQEPLLRREQLDTTTGDALVVRKTRGYFSCQLTCGIHFSPVFGIRYFSGIAALLCKLSRKAAAADRQEQIQDDVFLLLLWSKYFKKC